MTNSVNVIASQATQVLYISIPYRWYQHFGRCTFWSRQY